MTEIPTAAGKLYLATVIDLYSRRLLGAAISPPPQPGVAEHQDEKPVRPASLGQVVELAVGQVAPFRRGQTLRSRLPNITPDEIQNEVGACAPA
ncbi:MAG: integrase [Blastococcus sp.]|jgi:hypothetical protein|nr:integrase [Blastococcus sp.]